MLMTVLKGDLAVKQSTDQTKLYHQLIEQLFSHDELSL